MKTKNKVRLRSISDLPDLDLTLTPDLDLDLSSTIDLVLNQQGPTGHGLNSPDKLSLHGQTDPVEAKN